MANVERLEPAVASALARRVAEGAGLLIAPGRHVDAAWWNAQPWLPARLEGWQSVEVAGAPPPHPAPASFQGERLTPLAAGEAPPLGVVALLGSWRLVPDGARPGAVVLARLDTGDPWIVERPLGRGRVVLLAGPLDAEGGTLPVNPDFVPLLHELVTLLAAPGSAAMTIRTGEPLVAELDATLPDEVTEATIRTPDGQAQRVPLDRGGGRIRLRYDATDRPGVYQVSVAGRPRFGVTAQTDPLEAAPAPLARSDRDRLSADWPLRFLDSPTELGPALLRNGSAAGPRPLWRWLVLAALAGLCFEVYVTRRLASRRGVAGPDAFFD
jgi:hypothetical protein